MWTFASREQCHQQKVRWCYDGLLYTAHQYKVKSIGGQEQSLEEP